MKDCLDLHVLPHLFLCEIPEDNLHRATVDELVLNRPSMLAHNTGLFLDYCCSCDVKKDVLIICNEELNRPSCDDVTCDLTYFHNL